MRRRRPEPVYLEEGRKRTFAVAVGWPGWARSARTAEAALDALDGYRDRYAAVVRAAGVAGPPAAVDLEFEVVARVPGNATTDFGAPGVVPDLDRRSWPPGEAERQARLVTAAWQRLDEIAAGAPVELRKGPRGGGRDRDAVVAHVLDAEHAFRRKAGLRIPPPKTTADVAAAREAFVDLVRSAPSADDAATGWPLAYAVRRVVWHVLDHAWEIEDRSGPA